MQQLHNAWAPHQVFKFVCVALLAITCKISQYLTDIMWTSCPAEYIENWNYGCPIEKKIFDLWLIFVLVVIGCLTFNTGFPRVKGNLSLTPTNCSSQNTFISTQLIKSRIRVQDIHECMLTKSLNDMLTLYGSTKCWHTYKRYTCRCILTFKFINVNPRSEAHMDMILFEEYPLNFTR